VKDAHDRVLAHRLNLNTSKESFSLNNRSRVLWNTDQDAYQEQQRMQTADVAGRQFVFNQTENREMQQLNRVAGQLGAAQQAVSQANSDATAATLGMIGGITSSISSAASAYKA